MPFEAGLSEEEGFVRLRGLGGTDARSSAQAVRDLMRLDGFRSGTPILADLRDLAFVPTARDVEMLTQPDAVPAYLRDHPTALVAAPGVQYGVARRFATLSCIAGATVEVFFDPDSAVRWLGQFVARPSESRLRV